MTHLEYSITQSDILARKHIVRERKISHPVSHDMIQEVALGPSPGQLHFRDCFHVLNLLKLNHYYWHNISVNLVNKLHVPVMMLIIRCCNCGVRTSWPWTIKSFMILSEFVGWVTSLLVTDVGDEMCWWQVWDVDDWFDMLVINSLHSIPTSLSTIRSWMWGPTFSSLNNRIVDLNDDRNESCNKTYWASIGWSCFSDPKLFEEDWNSKGLMMVIFPFIGILITCIPFIGIMSTFIGSSMSSILASSVFMISVWSISSISISSVFTRTVSSFSVSSCSSMKNSKLSSVLI